MLKSSIMRGTTACGRCRDILRPWIQVEVFRKKGNAAVGYHQLTWSGVTAGGQAVPIGIYIARLVTAEYTKSINMVLLKWGIAPS